VIRVAAVGDVHYDRGCRNRLKYFFEALNGRADLLVLTGDLTKSGLTEEAEVLADDLRGISVPVVAILGNHDYHQDQQQQIHEVLRAANILSIEGDSTVVEVHGKRVAVVGVKGFGGGFGGGCCTEFGEPETKAFARHAKNQADLLRECVQKAEGDYKIVLLHYSPVESTLLGERRELYPFLGSYLLANAIDCAGADIVFHGHSHFGTERGTTPGGIPVRNVAQMVIRHAYNIYSLVEAGHPGYEDLRPGQNHSLC